MNSLPAKTKKKKKTRKSKNSNTEGQRKNIKLTREALKDKTNINQSFVIRGKETPDNVIIISSNGVNVMKK